jgi:hypothetical protein
MQRTTSTLVEQLLGGTIGDRAPAEYDSAQPFEEDFSEGVDRSVRHFGRGSRIRDKMNAEERAVMAREKR